MRNHLRVHAMLHRRESSLLQDTWVWAHLATGNRTKDMQLQTASYSAGSFTFDELLTRFCTSIKRQASAVETVRP